MLGSIYKLRLLPLVQAIQLSVVAMTVVTAASSTYAAEFNQSKHYQISAGSLTQALNEFSIQSGALFSATASLTDGLQSKGLNGSYAPIEGFNALLLPHNLQAIKYNDTYQLVSVGTLNTIEKKARVRKEEQTILNDGKQDSLPTIVVTASNEEDSYSAKKVQAGSKIEQSLKEVPRSISVINRKQMDDQGLTRLDDAIAQLPGVTILKNTDGWGDNDYSARGFSLNGTSIDGSASGASNISLNNTGLAKYDSVQLVRGPDGLFSGNGSAGGGINLTRKHALDYYQLLTTFSGGSWNNYLGEIDISSPINQDGSIRGRAVASYNNTEKFYKNAHSKYTTLYGIVDVDMGDKTTFSIGASYDKTGGSGYDSAPSYPMYSNGQFLNISRKIGYMEGFKKTNESSNVFAQLKHQFNDQWKTRLNLSYIDSNAYLSGQYYGGAADPVTNTGTYLSTPLVADQTLKALSADWNIQGDLDLWGHSNTLVLGADYVNTKRNNDLYDSYLTYEGEKTKNLAINWATFNPAKVSLTLERENFLIHDYTKIQKGIYLYDRFQVIGPLKLSIGGRLASYSYNLTSKWEETRQKNNSIFTPYYALQYDLLNDWTAYLAYTESYEDQSNSYTKAHKPLDPATGSSHELGFKGELLDGKLNTNITLYRTVRDNVQIKQSSDSTFTETGRSCCYVEGGKYLGKGVEFDISGEILPNLQLNAGYTYDDSTTQYNGTDSESGQRIMTDAPKNTFRAWTSYSLNHTENEWLNRLVLGGGVKAQTSFYKSGSVATYNPATGKFDGDNVDYNFTAPGRAVWDAFASYKIKPEWLVNLNIYNLFNKDYLQSIYTTESGNVYGSPRSFVLSVKGKF